MSGRAVLAYRCWKSGLERRVVTTGFLLSVVRGGVGCSVLSEGLQEVLDPELSVEM